MSPEQRLGSAASLSNTAASMSTARPPTRTFRICGISFNSIHAGFFDSVAALQVLFDFQGICFADFHSI
jgi:hypothetical protein